MIYSVLKQYVENMERKIVFSDSSETHKSNFVLFKTEIRITFLIINGFNKKSIPKIGLFCNLKRKEVLQMQELSVSKRLNDIIYEKSMTRKEFAAKLGVSPSTVQSWVERGDFPARYVIPSCKMLGVTPEYLLSGEGLEIFIPEDYVQLDREELLMIEKFRALDAEGRVVVLNKAIEEARRLSAVSTQGSEELNKRVG